MKKSSRTFLRVGITGGIGSGKSTVCKLFASLGRAVLSADEIAKRLTESSDGIKSSIKQTFGEQVFLSDHTIDRKALAGIVFNNPLLRKKLDSIIHPHVFAVIDRELKQLPASRLEPFVIIEAALIYESGMDENLDYVLVVDADEETRISRVMQRDNATPQEVLARIQSQMEAGKKRKLADFVIENDGSEEELVERVRFLDGLLAQLPRRARPSVLAASRSMRR
jgi:dephospho-CoA kinase